MRTRPLSATAAVLALLTACSMSAIAPRADLLGMAAPPSAANRTIVLTPATRWVNVTGGDTVRFVVGDREFAWNFSVGSTVNEFDLGRVAPPGLLDHPVPVYVDPDPYYSVHTEWNSAVR